MEDVIWPISDVGYSISNLKIKDHVIAIRPFGGEATSARQSQSTCHTPTGTNELMANEPITIFATQHPFFIENLGYSWVYFGKTNYFNYDFRNFNTLLMFED